MKQIANIILFTAMAYLYVYLAVKDSNYYILLMLPIQFLFGVVCFFLKPVAKSGFGMIVSIMIVFADYLFRVTGDKVDPFNFIEVMKPIVEPILN